MNILFVIPPPHLPARLNRIRAFELIKILSKKHQIHLISATIEKKIPKDFLELKKYCKSIKIVKINKYLAAFNFFLFPHLPLEVSFCYSKKVVSEIRLLIKKRKIDLLYFKRLRSAVYFSNYNIPILLDSTDAMSMFYFRLSKHFNFPKKLFYYFEAIKYSFYEKGISKKIKNWLVCSEVDKKYLASALKKANLFTIPNPVNIDYFKPKTLNQGNNILISGLMDKPINIDGTLYFLKEIYPLIKNKILNLRILIAGPNPPKKIKDFHDGKKIYVFGFVPELIKLIAQSKIIACPIRIGSGTRNKILQSWAMGKAVVSTTQGAEGLNYIDNYNIAIADSKTAFAKKILILFNNSKNYQTLVNGGLETVKKEYSFKAIEKKLNQVLRNVKSKKISG